MVHILFFVEGVFCQQHRQLSLDSGGWSQRLIVQLKAFSGILILQGSGQDPVSQLLGVREKIDVQGIQRGLQFVLFFLAFLHLSQGEIPKADIIIGDTVFFRIF